MGCEDGGAAGRVVFDKVERDGDHSGSETSDGNNIVFFEEDIRWGNDEYDFTVVDDDLKERPVATRGARPSANASKCG